MKERHPIVANHPHHDAIVEHPQARRPSDGDIVSLKRRAIGAEFSTTLTLCHFEICHYQTKIPQSGRVAYHIGRIFTGSLAPYNLNIIMRSREERSVRGSHETMGVFILGLIVGAVGALLFFIYDEGELFLKLARQIKQTAERYKQSS